MGDRTGARSAPLYSPFHHLGIFLCQASNAALKIQANLSMSKLEFSMAVLTAEEVVAVAVALVQPQVPAILLPEGTSIVRISPAFVKRFVQPLPEPRPSSALDAEHGDSQGQKGRRYGTSG